MPPDEPGQMHRLPPRRRLPGSLGKRHGRRLLDPRRNVIRLALARLAVPGHERVRVGRCRPAGRGAVRGSRRRREGCGRRADGRRGDAWKAPDEGQCCSRHDRYTLRSASASAPSDLHKKGGVARVIERRSPCANAAPCRKVDLCPHGTSPLTPVRSSCNPLPRRRRSRSVAPLAELSPLCPVGRAGSAADLRSLPLPGDPL